jgi:hypothetical protein
LNLTPVGSPMPSLVVSVGPTNRSGPNPPGRRSSRWGSARFGRTAEGLWTGHDPTGQCPCHCGNTRPASGQSVRYCSRVASLVIHRTIIHVQLLSAPSAWPAWEEAAGGAGGTLSLRMGPNQGRSYSGEVSANLAEPRGQQLAAADFSPCRKGITNKVAVWCAAKHVPTRAPREGLTKYVPSRAKILADTLATWQSLRGTCATCRSLRSTGGRVPTCAPRAARREAATCRVSETRAGTCGRVPKSVRARAATNQGLGNARRPVPTGASASRAGLGLSISLL